MLRVILFRLQHAVVIWRYGVPVGLGRGRQEHVADYLRAVCLTLLLVAVVERVRRGGVLQPLRHAQVVLVVVAVLAAHWRRERMEYRRVWLVVAALGLIGLVYEEYVVVAFVRQAVFAPAGHVFLQRHFLAAAYRL